MKYAMTLLATKEYFDKNFLATASRQYVHRNDPAADPWVLIASKPQHIKLGKHFVNFVDYEGEVH